MPSKKTVTYLLLAVFFFMPWAASAADILVVPYLEATGGYSDNIYFSEIDKIDDYIFIASPGIKVDSTSELLDLKSEIRLDIVRYLDETDQNTINQRYMAAAVYRAWEKLSFKGNFSYIKDSTLESELEETGIVGRLSNRHSYDAGGGLTYQISMLSDIDIDYGHRTTAYDLREYADSTSDTVSVTYKYKINPRPDVLSIKPSYKKLDSDISETDIYDFTIGLTRLFSATLQGSFGLGISYSDIWYSDHDSETNWGWTADVSLKKTLQTASAVIRYTRKVDYTNEGEPAEINRVSLQGNKTLTDRLSVGFMGSFYFTQSLGEEQSDVDKRYLEVTPSISYMITGNHSLSVIYDYSWAQDRNLTDNNEADRNMVWLIFNFSFPQKW